MHAKRITPADPSPVQALLSCPTFSIHCRSRTPGELAAARDSFPLPVPGCPGVHWCGYTAESSYGATAYFIRRPQVTAVVWWTCCAS